MQYEQNEIEFLPVDIEEAADQLVIAKWILRTLAYQYGVDLTFAPKITTGKAGSGLHIHTRLMKEGKNMYIENGQLTEAAKKAIAGILEIAPSLTALVIQIRHLIFVWYRIRKLRPNLLGRP